LFQEGHVRFLL